MQKRLRRYVRAGADLVVVNTVIVLDVQKPIRMVYWFTDREISFLERDLR